MTVADSTTDTAGAKWRHFSLHDDSRNEETRLHFAGTVTVQVQGRRSLHETHTTDAQWWWHARPFHLRNDSRGLDQIWNKMNECEQPV